MQLIIYQTVVKPLVLAMLTLLIVETRGFSVLRGLPSGTDTVL